MLHTHTHTFFLSLDWSGSQQNWLLASQHIPLHITHTLWSLISQRWDAMHECPWQQMKLNQTNDISPMQDLLQALPLSEFFDTLTLTSACEMSCMNVTNNKLNQIKINNNPWCMNSHMHCLCQRFLTLSQMRVRCHAWVSWFLEKKKLWINWSTFCNHYVLTTVLWTVSSCYFASSMVRSEVVFCGWGHHRRRRKKNFLACHWQSIVKKDFIFQVFVLLGCHSLACAGVKIVLPL